MELSSKTVLKIASYLSKIHHTPGRLRVRVNKDIKDEAKNLDLESLDSYISKIDGIKNVKFNKLVGSVTIEYDKDIFSKNFWDDMLDGKNLDIITEELENIIRGVKC